MLRGEARSVTLYDLDAQGFPKRRVDANGARQIGNGLWLLDSPRSVELDGDGLVRNPRASRLVNFSDETSAEINTAHLTPSELRETLADPDLDPAIRDAYRTDLQMKLATPLACLLLPLTVLFFATTGPPFPRPVHTLILSAAIAVTLGLTMCFAASLGHGGTLSPWLAGWVPSILLGIAAAVMGWRLRLRRRLSRAG